MAKRPDHTRMLREHRIAACEYRYALLRDANQVRREGWRTAARIHEGLARAHIHDVRKPRSENTRHSLGDAQSP